ncbi:hypothetical protein QFZ79_003357 [Arthrobacter sp. V4I6]|uniref:hypothetical protein n=1 Tax=unclassified Arthrobacter TaxID=235627 RepID=UPI002786E9DF|nr:MULTISPECIES: hypothetical protein [unclassified Arthrobacter]MDQ0820985.1 hypothetical protein [Arthrobacter sp. V1I7]MDQ0855246.1 hypothetical protein [Arthrobacter sp. V4I6]
MNDKLSILVRVDLDCAKAQVAARGHVTLQSIQALYVVVKRANALLEGLVMEVDVSHAKVDPVALVQLRAFSRSRHLPELIDPFQADCRFSIVGPDDALTPASPMRLAA